MNHSRHGCRALVLVIFAALGVIAFAATSAQAQTGWLLNKAFITATKEISGVIHPLADGKKHASLLTMIGPGAGVPIEILCETLTTDDGLLFANEKAEGRITLLYTKCSTFLNNGKTASSACKPEEPIVAQTKFHAILHTSKEEADKGDGKTYLLFEPEVKGGTFTIFGLGSKIEDECLISEKISISGELVEECLNEKLEKNISTTDYCLADMTNHLLQEAPKKLFLLEGTKPEEKRYDELKFGTRGASLDGIISISDVGGGTFAVHI
jgi:hypothetical protein